MIHKNKLNHDPNITSKILKKDYFNYPLFCIKINATYTLFAVNPYTIYGSKFSIAPCGK